MHGNRVLDLIFVVFWSHALTHPCSGPKIIICGPSKYESRFLAVSFLSTSQSTSVFLRSSVRPVKFIISVS